MSAKYSPCPAVLFVALLLAACEPAQGPRANTGPVPAEHVSPVRVAAVTTAPAERELRLPGVVRAAQRAEPAFLHSGHLAERFVARGEQVQPGQRLASLQNPALGPALASAEARVREVDERLVQFEADLQRARELHAQGLASAELLDRTLAQRNAARESRQQALATVAEARDQLADAILRAPFAATVSELLVEPGDFVQAGQPVLALAGEAGLEVQLMLPEGLSRHLAPGSEVEVRAVSSGARVQGQLRELGIARAGRPAPAIVELADMPDFEPGLSVHVAIRYADAPALTVPLSAVVDPGTGQTRVFRIVSDRAEVVPVRPGRLVGATVEVTGALADGDLVVVAGHQQLLDGEAVRILP
jgi:RND family efflux transporter MFP subunit